MASRAARWLPHHACRVLAAFGRAPLPSTHPPASRLPLQERAKAFSSYKDYLGKDITSLVILPVWIMQPFTMLQVGAGAGRGAGCLIAVAGGCHARLGKGQKLHHFLRRCLLMRLPAARPRRLMCLLCLCRPLQNMGELMEHTDLLDKAAACEDPYER